MSGYISNEKAQYDVEAYPEEKHRSSIAPDESGAVHGEVFVAGNTTYHKLQRLATRFGVEARGIERVPADERTDKTTWKVGTMWCAANMVVSSFAIGVLAVPLFGLGFADSVLTILFINMLGVMPVCFFSTFGPKFGMRQMILSRFYFGYYGVKLSKCLSLSWTYGADQQYSRPLQLLGLPWMVLGQCHRWRSAPACSQPRLSWMGRHLGHCFRDVLHHAVWLQGRAHVRDDQLDSLLHRLSDRRWSVRQVWRLRKHSNGLRSRRGRIHPVICRSCLRLCNWLDIICIRLYVLPTGRNQQEEDLPLCFHWPDVPAVLH